MTLRYPALAAAMAAYDAGAAERDRLWSNINVPADLITAEDKECADLQALQLAFYRETKEYNSFLDCARLRADDIRRTAEMEI